MGTKHSFVLYHDIRKPLELLDDTERGRLFMAIIDYSEFKTVPDFDGMLKMAFAFIKEAIDRDTAAWEDKSRKRAEAGSKGGQQTAANRANAAVAEHGAANQAVPVPVPVPVSATAPVLFVPPSVEEVEDYCRKRGKRVDAERFVSHYEARGWMMGSVPMRSWKAAVENWRDDFGAGKESAGGGNGLTEKQRQRYRDEAIVISG